MGYPLKLVKDTCDMASLPLALNHDVWTSATAKQRAVATSIRQIVAGAADQRVGVGADKIADEIHAQLDAAVAGVPGYSSLLLCAVRAGLVVDGRVKSKVTIKRLVLSYRNGGVNALLPKHKGRVRSDRGWEVRAVELYNQPSKPGFAGVAKRLAFEGFAEATESRVKRYLQSLPATLGEHSPARVGKHLHKLKRQHFQRRHTDDLLVGEIYAGDGRTADVYVAHPNTGKPFRPELTVFIDIKSRYIVGWYMTESESGISTLFSLSHAMVKHDHVPAWVYIDRGAGYRAKMLSDESTGFYARFDIAVVGALPGNPHGKGWIERFFRTVRDDLDKFFANGQVYCGDDMAPETNRRLSAELAQGKRTLPSYDAYQAEFRAWLETYHRTPMDVLGGRTPGQVWAGLTPVSVGLDASILVRPHERRTVQRQTVRIHNRHYYHEALALYDAKEVDVEYDLHEDGKCWIFDLKGRLVCEAKLVKTIGVLPTSRIEEQRDKRLAGQTKRLERKLDEAAARRQDAITADDMLQGIEGLDPFAQLNQDATQAISNVADVEDIDILKWRDK